MNDNDNTVTTQLEIDSPLSLEDAKRRQKELNNFIASQMRVGLDYGLIPGCNKPSLWKPGAEKLLYYNGLSCRLEPTSACVVGWNDGFFNYEYKAVVFSKRTGTVWAEAFGSCNSKEAKYRYNWYSESKLPRGVNKDELESKKMKSRDGNYFLVYKLENDDPYSLVNTFQKMAQKRAMIGACLLATRASENFTQDMEEDDAPKTEAATSAEPEQKLNPEDEENRKRTEITNILLEATNGDFAECEKLLENLTSFPAKDQKTSKPTGKMVPGITDPARLSGTRLNIALNKARDLKGGKK